MEFRLLGPLQVVRDGRQVLVPAARQRALLAVLLLNANRVVPADALAEAIWDGEPPATARVTLQNYVMRLRQVVGPAVAERIVTRSPGYLVRVEAGELDLDEFVRLRDEGRQAMAAEDWPHAATTLRAALGHWHGEPLVDVNADAIRAEHLPHITELRLQALNDRIEADLHLGRHDELVAELRQLIAAHPLREHFHGQLMLVLYRSGRQAEALEVYQRLRQLLVDELGVDPSPDIRDLHQRLLANDPGLAAPSFAPEPVAAAPGPPTGVASAPDAAGSEGGSGIGNSGGSSGNSGGSGRSTGVVPAQLPADLVDFTGRESQVVHLRELIVAAQRARRPGAVIISAVAGVGGIGKTALAVHIAHGLRDHFPDGQLYINLQGATQPLDPGDVLGRFLRDLGVASTSLPRDVEERAARFRSVVADRRLLILLDDAKDAAQLRPLLPGSTSCGVLVTSRNRLSGLEGAVPLDLGALGDTEALDLFRGIVGAARVNAEPEATADVLAACCGLPLAIRIAGARLVARPTWTIRTLADRLSDAARRLDELTTGDLAVRASFHVSYTNLPSTWGFAGIDPARAFRLLGLHSGPDLSLQAAAAMLNHPPQRTEAILELLVDANLLETTTPGRYRLHDLLRAYAAERAAAEEPADDRMAAIRRLLTWYVRTAVAADTQLSKRRYRPPTPAPTYDNADLVFDDEQAAMAWADSERANMLAAARLAAELKLDTLAWQLAASLWTYFYFSKQWTDYIAIYRLGLACTERSGDLDGQAWMLNGLGMAALDLQQANEAIVHFGRALAIRHADNDQLHIAILLNNMAGALFDRGERDHAINCMRESLRILDELGDSHDREMVSDKRMLALANLTEAYRLLGQLPEASEYGVEYLAQATELDNRWQQVGALEELGHIYRLAGDRAKALDHLTRCLEMSAALNYRYGVARAHRQLGELLSVDVPDEARAHLRDAYEIFAELGDPAASAVQALLDGPDRPDHPSRPAELDGAADLDHDEPRVTTDGVDPDDERQTVDQ